MAVARIAGFHRIAADPVQLAHQLGLNGRLPAAGDLVRAARLAGLKARVLRGIGEARLQRVPKPAIIALRDGGYAVFAGLDGQGRYRVVDPVGQAMRPLTPDLFLEEWSGDVVLLARRSGAGAAGGAFGFRWFLPSLWRYRRPLGHVLLASLFVQLFALVTPLFFQVVVDKVLAHKSTATLTVVVVGLAGLGLFNVVLQYLRTYALSHTTNRIDVELGAKLFHHLMRLPLGYFETRAAGQTVARVRELETIRNFLTGQGLSSVIDLVFAFVFVGVLFAYSTTLTLVVLAAVPVYVLIAALIRPLLRERIKEKLEHGDDPRQILTQELLRPGVTAAVEAAGRTAAARAAC